MCLHVPSTIIEVNSLYNFDKQVIGRYFLGFSVSLFFRRRYVIPWQNHLGARVGSFSTFLKFLVCCAWVGERVSSQ